MPVKDGKWTSVVCNLEICKNWQGNNCESNADVKELCPNSSTCGKFELEDTNNKVITLEKNAFVYTAINVDGKNFVFRGDIEKYKDRLKFVDGKVLRK